MRTSLRELRNLIVVGPSSSGTADLAILAFDGGLVLIDRRGSRVFRSYGGGSGVDDQYVAWREAFTRHVPAPHFEVIDEGRMIAEEFVEGKHLLDVDADTRLTTIQILLTAYASLTAQSARWDASSHFPTRLSAALRHPNTPAGLIDEWRKADTDWLARPLAWIPSAYEATTKNLMVRTDGTPAPIDLGDLREEPFFSYPVGIITEIGGDVVERFLKGDLDPQMAALFTSAGMSWTGHRPQRVALLIARMLHAAACDDEAGADTLVRSVRRRWANLAPQLRSC